MQRISEVVDGLALLLIRPQRARYSESQLLGGREGAFALKGVRCSRDDFVLPNSGGLPLHASLYYQGQRVEDAKGKSAVIYCHGNCGCRLDANDVTRLLLPEDICVCCLDFSGSGVSGGEFITLGAREPGDLKFIVTFLRTIGIVQVGLWGRSMGAVTCLRYLHTEKDLSIAGIVADSPFTTLPDLMREIAKTQLPRLLLPLTGPVLRVIEGRVAKKAHFSLREVDSTVSAQECWVPALFCHGQSDSLIPSTHSDQIVAAYAGDCRLVRVKGDHNDLRPLHFQQAARLFFKGVLRGGIKTPEQLFAGVKEQDDRHEDDDDDDTASSSSSE